MIDKQGRLFGKVNVIDLLIVIIVIAVVGFGVMKLKAGKGSAYVEQKSDFTMKVLVKQLYKSFPEETEIGDKIYDSKNGKYLGVLTDKVITPSYKEVENDGVLSKAQVPDRFDVVYTIEGEGVYHANTGLNVGGEVRYMGHAISIKNDLYANRCIIIGLEVEGVE